VSEQAAVTASLPVIYDTQHTPEHSPHDDPRNDQQQQQQQQVAMSDTETPQNPSAKEVP
jgi:hypothetical protein